MAPLVSILIPAYNAAPWIGETIQSALAQTWPRKEIIVVDDGSSDDTLAVARRFASPTVTVVTQTNQGAATARNHALSLARGDYLQWLDADDLLAPDKIARQVEIARAVDPRTLLSAEWGSFFFRPERAQFTASLLWGDLAPVEWLWRKLQHNLFMQTATWLVSRELTAAAGPWNPRISYDDDGEYFARVLLVSDGVRFVPKARVLYRLSGSASLSHIGRSDRKLESLLVSMQAHIEYLRSLEDSPRVRAACLAYLHRNLILFYPQRIDLVERTRALATLVGGELPEPTMAWKYSWIQKAFGWDAAKRVQIWLPGIRWDLVRWWDKLRWSAGHRGPARPT